MNFLIDKHQTYSLYYLRQHSSISQGKIPCIGYVRHIDPNVFYLISEDTTLLKTIKYSLKNFEIVNLKKYIINQMNACMDSSLNQYFHNEKNYDPYIYDSSIIKNESVIELLNSRMAIEELKKGSTSHAYFDYRDLNENIMHLTTSMGSLYRNTLVSYDIDLDILIETEKIDGTAFYIGKEAIAYAMFYHAFEKGYVSNMIKEMISIEKFTELSKRSVTLHTTDGSKRTISTGPYSNYVFTEYNGRMCIYAGHDFIPVAQCEKLTYKKNQHNINKVPFLFDMLSAAS